MRNRGKRKRRNLGIFLQLKVEGGRCKIHSFLFISFIFLRFSSFQTVHFFFLFFFFPDWVYLTSIVQSVGHFLLFGVCVDSSCGGFRTWALRCGGRRWWRWWIAMELWVGIQEEKIEGTGFSGESFANIVRWFFATSFCIYWVRFVTRPWSNGFIGRFRIYSSHRRWHRSWVAATGCRDW